MSNTSLLGSYGGLGNTGLMFRNKIINGNFGIWQRGTSQTDNGYGSDDRWLNQNVGSTKTHSRQAFALGQTEVPGNPEYFSRTVVSSVVGASNIVRKIQKVEGVRTFAGQTATLSFWARADAPKNMAIEFYQNFGTGGSPSAPVTGIGVTTIALTTAWKYYTVTVDIPSIAGKTLGTDGNNMLEIFFYFDAGSNYNSRTNSLGQQSGTFDIAQVQLEAGPVATPFEHRPYGLELSLCQRYYQQIFQARYRPIGLFRGSGSTAEMNFMPFPVPMRAATTTTISSTGITYWTALNTSTRSTVSGSWTLQSNGSSWSIYTTGYTTNNGIVIIADYADDLVFKVDAEL